MKSRILYQYLLSYLLIFLLPLVVMTVTINKNAISNLQKEIEISNINKLKQARDLIDMRMRELGQIATRISYDPKLTPFMVRNYEYNSKEAIEELSKYKSSSSFIEELFLYFRDDTNVYSSEGLSSLQALTGYKYKNGNWSREQFYQDINTIEIPRIRPAENISIVNDDIVKCLTYLYPVSRNSAVPHATLLFLIKESTFINIINNTLGNYKSAVYILNEHKNIMLSETNGLDINTSDLPAVLNRHDNDGIYEVKLDHQTISLTLVKSRVTNWTFIMVMPADQFLARVVHVKGLAMQIVLILTLIGFGTALFLSMANYRPINNLTKSIRLYSPQKAGCSTGNELEMVRDTIDAAFESNRNLLNTLHKQQPLARNQFMLKLLKGHFTDEDEIYRSLASFNIHLAEEGFFVMLISTEEVSTQPDPAKSIGPFMTLLSEFSFPEGTAYAFELSNDNAAAVIANIRSTEETRIRQHYLADHLRSLCKDIYNYIPAIGIGNVYNSILQVDRSFVEASYAMAYRLKGGSGSILFYDEVKSLRKNLFIYPINGQAALVQSLKQGNGAVACQVLEEIFNSMKRQQSSIYLLKFMCFDVINTILKVLSDLKADGIPGRFESLADFKSMDTLKEALDNIIIEFCSQINSKETGNAGLKATILEYIHKNIYRYDLSLESVANTLKISAPYLSRFFKEQTGYTFSKYLWELRVKEVKRLLADTDTPIKKIIAGIGYIDEANFIRKFREAEGVTPGQYRQLNR